MRKEGRKTKKNFLRPKKRFSDSEKLIPVVLSVGSIYFHALKCNFVQEKDLKQKLNAKVKAMRSAGGETSFSLVESDDLLQLRTEADKAHAEVLSSLDLVPKSMLLN